MASSHSENEEEWLKMLGESEDLWEKPADRTLEDSVCGIYEVPPIPGLPYQDVWVSTNRQTFYSSQNGRLIEIPRSEWMTEEQYRNWLADGFPEQEEWPDE